MSLCAATEHRHPTPNSTSRWAQRARRLCRATAALVLCTTLAGCLLPVIPVLGEDAGAAFEPRPMPPEPRRIAWRPLPVAELRRVCAEAMGGKRAEAFQEVVGCAVTRKGVCTIYTHQSTTHTLLGHEVRHCFEGLFHD